MRGRLTVLLLAAALALLANLPEERGKAQACSRTIPVGGDLQAAVDAAAPGAVLCLEPGLYVGSTAISSRSDLTIQGAGRGKTVLVPGDRDVMLIFDSERVTVRGLTMAFGRPAGAYVHRSRSVVFEDVEIGGAEIGVHYDVGSIGRIVDSVVHSSRGDGVLIRNHANVTLDRTWSIYNGGVGVSSVGRTANTTVTRSIIAFNQGPGVFAGVTPCALLPPGQLRAPACYFKDLAAYVGEGNLILTSSLVLGNQSTGIVLFPGTRVTMRANNIWFNQLTGIFVWAASLQSEGDTFIGNEEHAVEVRTYPDPLSFGKVPAPFPTRPAGRINNARIIGQVPLDGAALGGGILSQGGNLALTNSQVMDNAGIGVSYVNQAIGRIEENTMTGNGGSAICLARAGPVTVADNRISGNLDDRVGVCREA